MTRTGAEEKQFCEDPFTSHSAKESGESGKGAKLRIRLLKGSGPINPYWVGLVQYTQRARSFFILFFLESREGRRGVELNQTVDRLAAAFDKVAQNMEYKGGYELAKLNDQITETHQPSVEI